MPITHPAPVSTLIPAASVTPQVLSKKSEKNMDKRELEGEVNQIKGKEELYKSSLNKLKDEMKGLKETIEELKKERVSIIHLEEFIK